MKRIGIALGGGGARGLAHIPMLEALEGVGVRPVAVAGTSIGAILGALYASGKTTADLRALVRELVDMPQTFKEVVESRRLPGVLEFIGLDLGKSGVFAVDKFLDALQAELGVSTFEELDLPLTVVAADFWARKEVVFDRGPIAPAVAASFAIPGVFKPVRVDDRVLIDGGCVNPVPYDLLPEDCDIVIAIDVLGQRVPGDDPVPSVTESIFNAFQIAEKTIVGEKIKANPPTIYVEPAASGVRVLDFHKADEIYAQAEPSRRHFEAALVAALGGPEADEPAPGE